MTPGAQLGPIYVGFGDAKSGGLAISESSKLYPENTVVNAIWLPISRAAIELKRGQPAGAVELLRPVEQYEAGAEFWPQYVRGSAWLSLKKAPEAEIEFRKILAHAGQDPISPLYPLAQLGIARAAELKGEAAEARLSRQEFLTHWKQADRELPALVFAEAQANAVHNR
jgi:hypothetical protein